MPNKKLSARCTIPCVGVEVSETSKTLQAIDTDLDCTPELDGMILLSKAAHILVTGYREIKLVLTLLLDCLAFIIPEGTVWADIGKKKHQQFI